MTNSTSPDVLQVSSRLTYTGLLTTISFGARCRFQFLSDVTVYYHIARLHIGVGDVHLFNGATFQPY